MRALLVAVFALAACKETSVEMPKVEPVTAAQAEDFAKRFEVAMSKCTHDVEDMVDLDTMLRMGLAGKSMDRDFLKGVLQGARQSNSTSQMLCGALQGGSYKLLRIRTIDGEPRPIFRSVIKDGGFNYHELRLGTSEDNHKVRAVDMYVYISGENMSATFAELFGGAMKSMDRGEDLDAMKNGMTSVRRSVASGNYKEAHDQIRKLPTSMRATKAVRLLAIQAEMHLDEGDYMAMIDNYRKDFPGDPSIDMVSIDGYFLHKDYAGARKTLDHLDQRVGGDPYIDTLRSHMYAAEDKLPEAVQAATSATTREPGLVDGWYALVDADAATKDFAGAVKAMDVLKQKFSIVFDEAALATQPHLAAVIASPAYKAWKSAP